MEWKRLGLASKPAIAVLKGPRDVLMNAAMDELLAWSKQEYAHEGEVARHRIVAGAKLGRGDVALNFAFAVDRREVVEL